MFATLNFFKKGYNKLVFLQLFENISPQLKQKMTAGGKKVEW